MAGAANVLIKIGANAGQAVSEISKVNKALGDQMSASQKAGLAVRKAAVPAGIALAALGAAAISCAKAAADDEAAQVKLAGALRRGAHATDAAIAGAETYISKLSLATGVADDELRPALSKLATATGSVTQAQQGLSIALDVSAATGKNVDSVSKALAKAYAGNGAALAKLIPGIDQAAIKSGDFAKINKELARLTGGAAAESAKTASGQFRIFQVTLQETKESIGTALLPVLNQLAPKLVELSAFIMANTDLIVKLVAAVAGLAGVIVSVNAAISAYNAISGLVKAATVAWTAAQWLLNVALSANPIGIIIIAIAALVAGIVIAYRNSETFRKIVDTVWAAIKTGITTAIRPFINNWDAISAAIDTAIGYLRRFWPLLLPGGAFYMALKFLEDRFGVVTTAAHLFASAFGAIVTGANKVVSVFQRVIDLIGKIRDGLGGLGLGGLAQLIPGTRTGALTTSYLGNTTPMASTIVHVTINGPIDADSTAREIRALLQQYDTRYAIA